MDSKYGEFVIVPDTFVVAESDAECGELVAAGKQVFVPMAGDLALTLGASGTIPQAGSRALACSIDVLCVQAKSDSGERRFWFAVSSVSIGKWWSGEWTVITSTGRLDGLEVCPRAHPGDGFADLFVMQSGMRLRQRIAARKKMRSGSHLPHPQMRVSKVNSLNSNESALLTIDGVPRGHFCQVEIELKPGFATALVALPA